jgi:hypothetical protein
MRSFMTKESAERPAVGNRRLTWIMATEAARQTSRVVRRPAAFPCSVRLYPITIPAMMERARRIAMSVHPMFVGIPVMVTSGAQAAPSELNVVRYQPVLVK